MATANPPPVPGVRHRHVRVDGVRLHVAEAGQGPAVVLVHGWPQHWWCWRHVIPELAESYRVLVPDLRGFGSSDAPPGDYAKASFAADLLALLDAEGIGRALIAGHDWGGYAALLLALDYPERVERLVALDIAPPWSQRSRPHPGLAGLPLLASYQALLATPILGPAALRGGPQLVRTLIRAGSGPRASWTEGELDQYADVLREPARARASSACYRTFLTRELPAVIAGGDRSEELRVPTLLAMGAASALYRVLRPRSGANLRVEAIPGAGHFLPEEAPSAVVRMAEQWFESRPTSGEAGQPAAGLAPGPSKPTPVSR
jgi:pimeloyl-ACP methyl ester carboxylesterase